MIHRSENPRRLFFFKAPINAHQTRANFDFKNRWQKQTESFRRGLNLGSADAGTSGWSSNRNWLLKTRDSLGKHKVHCSSGITSCSWRKPKAQYSIAPRASSECRPADPGERAHVSVGASDGEQLIGVGRQRSTGLADSCGPTKRTLGRGGTGPLVLLSSRSLRALAGRAFSRGVPAGMNRNPLRSPVSYPRLSSPPGTPPRIVTRRGGAHVLDDDKQTTDRRANHPAAPALHRLRFHRSPTNRTELVWLSAWLERSSSVAPPGTLPPLLSLSLFLSTAYSLSVSRPLRLISPRGGRCSNCAEMGEGGQPQGAWRRGSM